MFKMDIELIARSIDILHVLILFIPNSFRTHHIEFEIDRAIHNKPSEPYFTDGRANPDYGKPYTYRFKNKVKRYV